MRECQHVSSWSDRITSTPCLTKAIWLEFGNLTLISRGDGVKGPGDGEMKGCFFSKLIRLDGSAQKSGGCNAPVEVGSLSRYLQGLSAPSQVVFSPDS